MEITMVNEMGCIIAEEYYDEEDASEAIKDFVNNKDISFEKGDVIQIR